MGFLWWGSKEKKEKPKRYIITRAQLKAVLKKGIKWQFIYEPFLADKRYIVPAVSEVKEALRKFERKRYVAERYDCDNISRDFSQLFPGMSVGEMYIHLDDKTEHAINFYVDGTRRLWLIDAGAKTMELKGDKEIRAFRGSCV